MIIAIFLIPFIEHLTERTKFLLIDWVLPDNVGAYFAHWMAPIIAFIWAVAVLWGLNQYTLESAILSAGGALAYYEISSIWRKQKREAVPISTKGMERDLIVE